MGTGLAEYMHCNAAAALGMGPAVTWVGLEVWTAIVAKVGCS